ncbi:MAG TPA: ABC transporter permease, partial [Acidimicrobiia bacterium]|nr:ABC transporter permease [Acidimicrobiia bacterium]
MTRRHSPALLRVRWSWRDLRARWLQVAAIALIIGIGSGTYSGLSSVSAWRHSSYDASYAASNMYDLRYEFATGSFVDAEQLRTALATTAAAGDVQAISPRLVQATQVDASTEDPPVLVPGRLVGVDVREGGPHVNAVRVFSGRALTEADAGAPVAVLDEHFADKHGIRAGVELRTGGGSTFGIVGRGLGPDDFLVIGDQGSLWADFAVLYAPLATVQAATGHEGQVNDVLITVRPGAERGAVEAQVSAALDGAFPDAGYTVTHQEDDRALRLLYDDIDGDQRFYNIFAVLIL